MEISAFQSTVVKLTEGIEHPRAGAALALCEESGELVRCVLDHMYTGKLNRDALEDEVGDLILALAEFCDRFDVSLDACADRALEKLRRKAPGWRDELGDRLVHLRAVMDAPDCMG